MYSSNRTIYIYICSIVRIVRIITMNMAIEFADLPSYKMVMFQFAFCMFTRGESVRAKYRSIGKFRRDSKYCPEIENGR